MLPVVGAGLSKRLVPGELWEPAGPLLPSSAARPRGGGTAPCDEQAVFTAVVFALTSGCAWRHLPPTSGTSPATAHRRFTVWDILEARCVVADPELAEQSGVPALSRRDRTTRRPERSAHARPSPNRQRPAHAPEVLSRFFVCWGDTAHMALTSTNASVSPHGVGRLVGGGSVARCGDGRRYSLNGWWRSPGSSSRWAVRDRRRSL
ncbi:transposase [Streptomyces sp. NPDC059627]